MLWKHENTYSKGRGMISILPQLIIITLLSAGSVAMGVAATTKGTTTKVGSTTKPIATTLMTKTTFLFAVRPGQYIFIGNDTGLDKGTTEDKGVEPLANVRIVPDAVPDKWDLVINVQPIEKNLERGLKWDANVIANNTDSKRQPQEYFPKLIWETRIERDKKRETVDIIKVDLSKQIGISGLQLYNIPYAKINGELYHLVVAIGDNPSVFSKAITIPKKYIFYKWNNWSNLESSQE